MSFSCPKCNEKFNKELEIIPKILKCGDTICSKCLSEIFEKPEKQCPVCSGKINENTEDVRTNIFAYNNKNAIVCGLCLKEFDDEIGLETTPKVLKCGDTICSSCFLKNYINNEIFCPFCANILTEKIEEIPVNKLAMELVEDEILNNSEFINSNESSTFDYEFSIGIMGDINVGKTSITHYFYKGKPLVKTQNTIGFEFHYKYLTIKNKNIKIRLWDTAGQEAFRSYSLGLLRGVDAVVIVFSLTVPYDPELSKQLYDNWKNADKDKKEQIEKNITKAAFNQVRSWYRQFTQMSDVKDKTIYLLGNKVDDIEHRVIKKEDALKLAKELSLEYFETSAITGKNIYKIFSKLCQELIKKIERKGGVSEKNIKVSSQKAKKDGCC